MNIDLSGKTAIVTGSTEGIGFAAAQGLARAGATVVVNGRTPEKVKAALAELSGAGRGVAADLGTAEGCATLVAAEPQADIVVSNLGVFAVEEKGMRIVERAPGVTDGDIRARTEAAVVA